MHAQPDFSQTNLKYHFAIIYPRAPTLFSAGDEALFHDTYQLSKNEKFWVMF